MIPVNRQNDGFHIRLKPNTNNWKTLVDKAGKRREKC